MRHAVRASAHAGSAVSTAGGGDIAGWRAGSRARTRPVVAKRSAKKRQARNSKRGTTRGPWEKLAEERAARLAAAEGTAPAAPAAHRPERREGPDSAARTRLSGGVGARRRGQGGGEESEDWDPSRGYKPFDDVQDAVYDMALAKTAVYESHPELALSLLTVARGEAPSSLDGFDWVYQRGVADGNVSACRSCSRRRTKANVVGVVQVQWWRTSAE